MPVELSHDQHVSERDSGLAPAIEAEDLHKRYGDRYAVDGLSFQVEILEGHLRGSAGRVCVLGQDPERGGRAVPTGGAELNEYLLAAQPITSNDQDS
jgi:hypothetical protein